MAKSTKSTKGDEPRGRGYVVSASQEPAGSDDRNAVTDLNAGTDPRDTSEEAVKARRAAQDQYLKERRVSHAQLLEHQLEGGKVPWYVYLADPDNPADAANFALNEDEREMLVEPLRKILKARQKKG